MEMAVLEKLIFEESFENILIECRELALPTVISDILKYLIQHKLVVAKVPQAGTRSKSGFFYDSDNMNDYLYQATTKGVKILETLKKEK